MPNPNTIPLDTAKIYRSDLNVSVKGEFIFLRNQGGVNVYVYSFIETASCSEVGPAHNQLPAVVDSLQPISDREIFLRQYYNGAANVYLYSNKDETDIEYLEQGKYRVTHRVTHSSRSRQIFERSEAERMLALKEHLSSTLRNSHQNISVDIVLPTKKKYGKNFCHFTGGGDIQIARKDNQPSFVLMSHELSEFDDESPVRHDESRDTIDIECKVASTKSMEDVELQLQANMYNLLVRRFISKLKDGASNVNDVNCISIYGMSFGLHRPVEVLKLTVNFSLENLHYERKYVTYQAQEVLIDACIGAVLERITSPE